MSERSIIKIYATSMAREPFGAGPIMTRTPAQSARDYLLWLEDSTKGRLRSAREERAINEQRQKVMSAEALMSAAWLEAGGYWPKGVA